VEIEGLIWIRVRRTGRLVNTGMRTVVSYNSVTHALRTYQLAMEAVG